MWFTSSWLVLALAGQVQQSNAGQVQQPSAPVQAQPVDPQADKPIVSDPQFDSALPVLSDDINAPLEPMPAAPGAAPSGNVQPTGANEALAPVMAETPELTAPLPPLGTFDSTPPTEVADIDDKDVVIRYTTVVRGLDDLDLTGQFNGLSALKEGGGKAANAAMITARAREDEALAVRLMKSKGYYDGTAISTIEQPPANAGDPIRAIVSATPGNVYTLSSVKIDAGPVLPPDLLIRELPLKIGDRIEADRIQGAEANLALKLPQQGYPFVAVGQRDILLDDAKWTGDYTLPVDTGPRSSFGTYSTEGKLAFDAKHVGVLARFKDGELYDNRKVDDLRDALVATGLFSTVSVEPRRTGVIAADGTEKVDLLVRQEAGPPRSLAATAGYSTGEGIKVEGSFTHRNVFPPEGALIGTVIAGTQEQGLSGTFRRSNAGKRDRTVTITAAANHSNYDAFNAFTGTLSARISYDSTPIWQKKFTYAFGVELVGTNESVYDFGLGRDARRTYGIAALPSQVQFDTSDSLLNPTKGYRLKFSLSPEASVSGGVRPYARVLVEGSIYQPVSESIVLAGRIRAGTIPGIARDDLAPSRRFYGGGGGSVRGYGYQRLGPFDPNGDPVGGRSINEFSLEARYRFGNFGIVPFIDGGNAYEGITPKGSDLRYGAGIGGRFYTNFGPMRVDVATPLNPRPGDGKVALYISIGQAF
ncbi:BamA/TamA family outer membrane protein [Sphingomonas aliaeris]|uniref:BamA/TamA family outer membrane protein n=1 Tax=Sphingomonas aliaeris TaxID=2759526 RepID=A0A974S5T1_9SPHN|nr:BamA/TamA family outer membrane protein [Sphingomonas aliaeris]